MNLLDLPGFLSKVELGWIESKLRRRQGAFAGGSIDFFLDLEKEEEAKKSPGQDRSIPNGTRQARYPDRGTANLERH